MKKTPILSVTLGLISSLLYCSVSLAFSSAPDDIQDYEPADWENSQSAREDAIKAVENNDLRLLGFAFRNYSIPGVEFEHVQSYIDQCGVRTFDEFSDVIRDAEHREKLMRANEYAGEYNAIILQSCELTE